MTQEIILTSDIGNEKSLKLKEFMNDITLYDSFQSKHHNIKTRINDIFRSYLSIGYDLIDIQEKGYLEVTEYASILDYAYDQFDLSSTTTSNIMNIAKRFGLNQYAIKPEYRDYQFSKLVEMINVPEEELSLYKPEMTIKEIRIVKKLSNVQERLTDLIGPASQFDNYVHIIKNYDWFKDIKEKDDITFITKIKEPDAANIMYEIAFNLKSKKYKTVQQFKLKFRRTKICIEKGWQMYTILNEEDLIIKLDVIFKDFKKDLKDNIGHLEKQTVHKKEVRLFQIYDYILGYNSLASQLIYPYLQHLYYEKEADALYVYEKDIKSDNLQYLYKITVDPLEIKDYDERVILSIKDFRSLVAESFKVYGYEPKTIPGQMTIDELQDGQQDE